MKTFDLLSSLLAEPTPALEGAPRTESEDAGEFDALLAAAVEQGGERESAQPGLAAGAAHALRHAHGQTPTHGASEAEAAVTTSTQPVLVASERDASDPEPAIVLPTHARPIHGSIGRGQAQRGAACAAPASADTANARVAGLETGAADEVARTLVAGDRHDDPALNEVLGKVAGAIARIVVPQRAADGSSVVDAAVRTPAAASASSPSATVSAAESSVGVAGVTADAQAHSREAGRALDGSSVHGAARSPGPGVVAREGDHGMAPATELDGAPADPTARVRGSEAAQRGGHGAAPKLSRASDEANTHPDLASTATMASSAAAAPTDGALRSDGRRHDARESRDAEREVAPATGAAATLTPHTGGLQAVAPQAVTAQAAAPHAPPSQVRPAAGTARASGPNTRSAATAMAAPLQGGAQLAADASGSVAQAPVAIASRGPAPAQPTTSADEALTTASARNAGATFGRAGDASGTAGTAAPALAGGAPGQRATAPGLDAARANGKQTAPGPRAAHGAMVGANVPVDVAAVDVAAVAAAPDAKVQFTFGQKGEAARVALAARGRTTGYQVSLSGEKPALDAKQPTLASAGAETPESVDESTASESAAAAPALPTRGESATNLRDAAPAAARPDLPSSEVPRLEGATLESQLEAVAARTDRAEPAARRADKGGDPLARVEGFARGARFDMALSAYGGRGHEGADHGAHARRGELREREESETQSEQSAAEPFAPAAPEAPLFAAQPQAPREVLAQPNLAPLPSTPLAEPPPELPDFELARTPLGQPQGASISLHHPDLGPIQIRVQRSQDRVEVSAIIDSPHAEAVLRANESGIRRGVQQSGMTFGALRVKLRGEDREKETGRPTQVRRRRANERGV